MASILLNFRGSQASIERCTLLLGQVLKLGRIIDLPDVIEPGKTNRLIEFDADQTLPLKPPNLPQPEKPMHR